MNKNKQSQLNAGRVRSLGLLDKTLPLTAATIPQLRNRRQFQFNGMQFETNPLSLHMPRGGLDGDAGDGRFPAAEDRRESIPYQTFKTSSPTSAISRVNALRSCANGIVGGNDMASPRMVPQLAASQPHLQRQPEERIPWRADNDNFYNQAGGEDAYTYSNDNSGYNNNNYSSGYNNSNDNTTSSYNNSNSYNSSSYKNSSSYNNSLSNNNNSFSNNSSFNNNNSNNNDNDNNNSERFHQILAKYSRQPLTDEYINTNNNNNSINHTTPNNNVVSDNVNNNNNSYNSNNNTTKTSSSYNNNNNNNNNTIKSSSSYNNNSNNMKTSSAYTNNNTLKASNSYNSNMDGNNQIEDVLNNSQPAHKEELLIPPRIYSRPLKLNGFRFGQMRAGGSFNAAGVNQSMDYITLTGFLLGYLTSNVLFFLCWYFSWLKGQVVKLRRHFLGHANLWEFFDFEDTTRYTMQTKLLLAPIILGCSILYCVVNILHLLIKLVRSDVPRTVVDFVQRIARSHWP
ncbi:GATA zinc finger domain-containing protein 14 [Drosophila montana]|uniref:GATA zinc finger domain-containing protein 14 n=1 Tax=Drosophila montana TaxID=40370 RepID=UPI00313C3F92